MNPSEPNFKIEWWPIDRPRDYPKNARKWSAKAVEKVASSIREYGWRQPIVVDAHDVIIIGHLRRASGRHAGMTECPVHVAHDLTPEQVRGLRLMDNRSHELASSIFYDARLVTVADIEHSDDEERWFSVGVARSGAVLLVVYKWSEADPAVIKIRLISARKATQAEHRHYEEGL